MGEELKDDKNLDLNEEVEENEMESLTNRHHQNIIGGSSPDNLPAIGTHQIRHPPTQAKFNRLVNLDMIHKPPED